MFGKGGLGDMMKQVQKMQARMAEVQEELALLKVEGSAGGGMVKVVANGRQEILSLTINPEVINPDEAELLQDMILAAVNQARDRASELQSEKMSAITGGMKIPGMNLPF